MDVLGLEDRQFAAAWRSFSDERRSEIGSAGFERYRKITHYVDSGIAKLRSAQEKHNRENGDDHIYDHIDDEREPDWARYYGGNDAPEIAAPKRNVINWAELAGQDPPRFDWLWDHWISWDPMGIWGRGGIGKSLLAQMVATACVSGQSVWGPRCAPVRVLYWACEDDKNELWRRQDRICKSMGIGFDVLKNLNIDARRGMENAIFTTEYGKPMWTPLYSELRAQVNDYGAQVLILDNISQLFGGNINDPHHVTTFVNGTVGLVNDRPFCPILLGHVAKVGGSEFSGTMAWENAVRMRWYFAEKLPDEAGDDQTEPGTEDSDARFLCKRKANYTARDYVKFDYRDGVFAAADRPDEGGMIGHLRGLRSKTVVLQATQRLAALGIFCSDTKGPNYLPSKIAEMKLGEGLTKAELRGGMNALVMDGGLVRGQVGKYSKGAPKFGLVVPPKA